jgi:hypothetical protein
MAASSPFHESRLRCDCCAAVMRDTARSRTACALTFGPPASVALMQPSIRAAHDPPAGDPARAGRTARHRTPARPPRPRPGPRPRRCRRRQPRQRLVPDHHRQRRTCNGGARSRRCHHVKQSDGWTVTQPLTRLAPVDHTQRPHLHPRTDEVPGMRFPDWDAAADAGRAGAPASFAGHSVAAGGRRRNGSVRDNPRAQPTVTSARFA